MTLSICEWNERVSIILIQFLQDPELVIYMMQILKQLRNIYLQEEARIFHESLRLSRVSRGMTGINMRYIRYFKKDFMKIMNEADITEEQSISRKINTMKRYRLGPILNTNILTDTNTFSISRIHEYEEALVDFEIFEEVEEPEYPHLLLLHLGTNEEELEIIN